MVRASSKKATGVARGTAAARPAAPRTGRAGAGPASEDPAARVVTKALVRAATALEVQQKELAAIVGVSDATVSRMFKTGRPIAPTSKEGELALLFLRVYRSIDAILGGNQESCRRWLHARNEHVGGVPLARMRTVEGLVHVAEYLDAMRGKV
jgi:hypothetical protein